MVDPILKYNQQLNSRWYDVLTMSREEPLNKACSVDKSIIYQVTYYSLLTIYQLEYSYFNSSYILE